MSAIIFDVEGHSINERYAKTPVEYFRIGGVSGVGQNDEVEVTDDYRQMNYDVVYGSDRVIGHNIMAFDLPTFFPDVDLLAATRARKVLDTWTMATVLDPPPDSYQPRDGARRFPKSPEQYKHYYSLDNLAFQYGVDGKSHDLKALAKERGDADACCTFGSIPVDDEDYRDYLRQDVRASRGVLHHLIALGRGVPEYVWREMRVAALASTVSRNGFRLDVDLAKQRVDANNEIRERNQQILIERYDLPVVNAQGKPAKNLTATKDGKRALHKALIEVGVHEEDIPRTKTGQPAFGSEPLQELAAKYAGNADLEMIVDTVAGIQGLRTVYQTALDNVHVDGFCHPDIFMLQMSGRWSLQDPGLSVFGKRDGRNRERDIFLPDVLPGEGEPHVLFSVDLSQIDARAVAVHSQDHNYLDLFLPGKDSHSIIAEQIWGHQPDFAENFAHYRNDLAKPLGHGTNYGLGLAKMAAMPGVGEARAREFREQNARLFPDLARWKQRVQTIGEISGRLDNGFGRILKINPQRAYTQSPAGVGQACARDLAMEGALKFDDAVARMCKAFVHDEFIFSAPISQARDVKQHVIECLTFEWAPPGASRPVMVEADATKFGLNWGVLYDK